MSEESPLANEVVASDDGEASDSGGEGGVLVVPPPSRSVTVTEATVTTTSMAVISMAEEEVKEGADDEGDENSRLEEPGQDRIVREVSEEHGSRREKEKKKKHKHKHDREDKDEASTSSDEEERLRRRLIEKEKKRTSEKESHEKRKRRSTEGEAEDELFAMRPEADLKRQKEREAVERREREEKRREEGRRGGDERDDGRRGGSDRRDPKQAERDRHRRDERSGRGGGSAMERGGGGRGPPSRGDSGRGDARPGERRGDDRKHRRSSRSRSRSADRKKVRGDERRGGRDERERKKDSRTPPAYRDRRDDKDRKERGEKERRKSPPKEGAKKEETEKEKEQKMEVDEAVAVPAPAEQGGSDGERADTPSPLASTAAAADEAPPENPKDKQRFAWETKKYSKFDSSPESDQLMDSPKSDIILRPSSNEADSDIDRSDVEMDEEEVEEEEEEAVDLSGIPWDELTEEQRGRLSPDTRSSKQKEWQTRLVSALPVYYPGISGCRNVVEFDCMNRIEEGTFGVVYRAKDKRTDEVVALKRLKMEKEKEGFPITSLREVNMLLKAGGHENVVNVKEIVVGSNMDKIFLVMEFVEHDVKSLMDTMHRSGKKFSTGEVKTLTRQLLAGMEHLHGLWILHRDLKTSNLLLSHKSVLKIADFGLAREYGHPLKEYTQVVVTLWYRSPELLLGIKKYSTAVDMWSVGCIMAEFILLKPLFPGKGEIDQVNKIFTELGTPNERVWPGYDELPGPKQVTFVQHSYNQLRKKFPASNLSQTGYFLLNSLLMYNPEKRVSATEALANEWFQEDPQPTAREMFPTWPAKSELHKKPPVDPAKKAAQEAAKKAQPAVQISREHAALFDNLNVKLDQAPKAFTLKF